jgi:plastocyanin
MKELKMILIAAVLTVALVFPMAVWAAPTETELAREDLCQNPANVPDDEFIQFGGNTFAPANHRFIDPAGDPADPNSLKDEVAINKGGTVQFKIVGGGHRVAIYRVSENTIRQDIIDSYTADLAGPVYDGDGNLIFVIGAVNPINYPQGRLLWLTGLNNGAIAANTTVQYRFEEDGLYLVICGNIGHFTDGMFGFVNVVNCFPKGN